MPSPDSYDRLPYTDHAYAESHPDRLAVVARLAGWEAPDVAGARVLELGCGRGGNLLPMASSLPGATLVGLDRSARQIDEARAIAAATSLPNVRFEVADVALHAPAETFDFVVCHGLASWVPPTTRAALLALVSQTLAPGGVAYVSFNTLPGWYDRLAARDFLRAFPGADPRSSLAWLRDAVSPEQPDYRRRLDAVLHRLRETDPAYAAHEYLAEEHHPMLVHQFLAEAAGAGLAYLGDAVPEDVALELLPELVRERAHRLGPAEAQQLVDFARNAAFRRTLLVREADAREREWVWTPELRAEALDGLRVASRLRPHAPEAREAKTEQFDGPRESVHLDAHGVRRALHELARIAPRSVPFPELARRVEAPSPDDLRADLLDLALATGAVDLHVHEPALADALSLTPTACPVARWHAAHGGPITNLWHQEVLLADPLLRWILARVDGRSQEALAHDLSTSPAASALDARERQELVRTSLHALASAALLQR